MFFLYTYIMYVYNYAQLLFFLYIYIMYVYDYTYIYILIRKYMFIYACLCAYMYICLHIGYLRYEEGLSSYRRTHICNIYIHIYICTHIYIHIYVQTHSYTYRVFTVLRRSIRLWIYPYPAQRQ
jgi:hypothetical protein